MVSELSKKAELSKKLVQARKRRHMTQAQLAERLNIAKSTVSTYELGSASPSAEVLCNICTVLDVQADYLLGLDGRQWICLDGLDEKQMELIERLVAALREVNES